jgi:hypothetical protein
VLEVKIASKILFEIKFTKMATAMKTTQSKYSSAKMATIHARGGKNCGQD